MLSEYAETDFTYFTHVMLQILSLQFRECLQDTQSVNTVQRMLKMSNSTKSNDSHF